MKNVPFEIAKKLKEKGFNLPSGEVIGKYDSDGVYHSQLYINFTETMDSEEIIAPTISQVLKWLREKNSLFIQIMFVDKSSYYYEVIDIATEQVKCSSGDYKESPEQAALAGIEYVLDNLI